MRVLFLGLVVALHVLHFTSSSALGDDDKTSSEIIVSPGYRLTFDPKTCTKGTNRVWWGSGSFVVNIVGQQDGHCVFDYTWEVEQPFCDQTYRVRVPVDSGPVVIDAEKQDGAPPNRWSIVYTSFTKQQAKLFVERRRGWDIVPLEGTKDTVSYQLFRRGDSTQPLKPGDKVTLRFLLFDKVIDTEFCNQIREKWGVQYVTLIVDDKSDWQWIEVASRQMELHEVRRVKVPAKVAGPAQRWLPGFNDTTNLMVEMQAISFERTSRPGRCATGSH